MRMNIERRRRIVLITKISGFIAILGIMVLFFPNNPSKEVLPSPIKMNTPKTIQTTHIIPFKGLSQEGFQTGCESVSTVSVLQHYNIDITVDEFIQKFLPYKEFYKKDGRIYGANPHEYFAGNPYKTASLGCYPKVILKALNSTKNANYPGMDTLHFEDISNSDMDSLLTKYIVHDIPILLWVTIDMKPSYAGMKYALEDGTPYNWTAQEHCVVLCGYTAESYYLMDPLKDGATIACPKEIVEQRYEELGKYALVIIPSDFL